MTKTETIPTFYRVLPDLRNAPLDDHLLHGYESIHDYRRALLALVRHWRDRVGEAVDERHGHLRIRFCDTPGVRPDEAWLPRFLLEPTVMPAHLRPSPADPATEELDHAFGFD